MQHHPHDKDEWGRYGQLRLGKVSAAPGPPAFHHHPHTLMLTQILTAKKLKFFTPPAPKVQRGEGGNIYSELRQKTSVTSSLTLCPYYMTKCDTYSKSRHTNTKHVHMLVDTNSPPPNPTRTHVFRGPADPLQLQQLYILRFYDLDLIRKCHRVALKGSA